MVKNFEFDSIPNSLKEIISLCKKNGIKLIIEEVTEEVVERIINEHIIGGKVVEDYVIGKFRI